MTSSIKKLLREMIRKGVAAVRYPNGRWAPRSVSVHQDLGRSVPAWSVTTKELQKLERDGLVERRREDVEEWRDPRELSADGCRYAFTLLPKKEQERLVEGVVQWARSGIRGNVSKN